MIITRAIGIDLSTTNSAVAMLELDDQNIDLFSDAQGRSTIPIIKHNGRIVEFGRVIMGAPPEQAIDA